MAAAAEPAAAQALGRGEGSTPRSASGPQAAVEGAAGGRPVAPRQGGGDQHAVGVLGPRVGGHGPPGHLLGPVEVVQAQQQLAAAVAVVTKRLR